VAYYNKIINKLVELNIDPFVTIYHWDLPQALEDRYQGWLSPKIAVDFGHYAGVLFREFGDRVKHWITVNEPWTFCYLGYVTGAFAPGRCSDRTKCPHGDSATEGYIAAHNVILSHATAVDLYRSSYQPAQKGTIGITVNLDWAEALNPDSVEDLKSAERWRQFVLGWFLDPLVYGTYPPAMIENVGARLPVFSAADAKKVKGSFDFIGLNHYSTKYTTHIPVPSPSSGWYDDMGVNETVYDRSGRLIGPQGDSTWLHVVPWGFYKLLKWVKNRYGNPTLFITENGCDVPNESGLSFSSVIQDDFRISYYSQYLKALDQAVFEGSDIRGYFAWSLLDNFEWADGYAFRFGLHYVNYSDPALPRYPKMSSVWYAQYIQSHRYKLENKEKDPSKHPGIDWGAHQYWKESYAYVNVLGPGKPVFGVYGTGY
jgi:beta-glucosidase